MMVQYWKKVPKRGDENYRILIIDMIFTPNWKKVPKRGDENKENVKIVLKLTYWKKVPKRGDENEMQAYTREDKAQANWKKVPKRGDENIKADCFRDGAINWKKVPKRGDENPFHFGSVSIHSSHWKKVPKRGDENFPLFFEIWGMVRGIEKKSPREGTKTAREIAAYASTS